MPRADTIASMLIAVTSTFIARRVLPDFIITRNSGLALSKEKYNAGAVFLIHKDVLAGSS